MNVTYDTRKELPCDALYQLFLAVGWADEGSTTPEMLAHFNIGFLHSTFVFSAWVDGRLVGCVRCLSDLYFRSVLYDLAVLPDFQRQGIGSELVRRCLRACKGSEWVVQTDAAQGFYEKLGFRPNGNCFLTLPSRWF